MNSAAMSGNDAPWKQRYRARQIYSFQIAEAAPERGLVVTTDRGGTIQLHAWDVASGDLRQITRDPQGVSHGFLAPAGRHVYFLDDPDGDEIGHLVRVPFIGGAAQDLTPDLPLYSHYPAAGGLSRDGTRLALTIAGEEGFSLLAVDLLPDGEISPPRVLHRDAEMFTNPVLSYDGALAVVSSTERTGDQHFSLIAFDTESGERAGELWDGPAYSLEAGLFAPLPGDERLVATTTRSGYPRPFLWHPRTGAREDLVTTAAGDVIPFDWSPDGAQLLLCHVQQAMTRLAVYDLAQHQEHALEHPRGSILGAYFAPENEIWMGWEDATHPPQVVALDGARGSLRRTVLAADPVPASHSWRSVTFPSGDGEEIQGWLALPAGDGPFPAVLDLHGGPEDVQTEVFAPTAQSWLDHGFAFLSINYRGSVTFGRAFQEQIWGRLGQLEISDVVAAREWLVAGGVARPDAIVLHGWSYGGYLTLLALGKHPALWAAGVAGAAIADWRMLYEDASESTRGYLVAMMGGTPEEKPEEYRAGSPLSYVEQVQAPVLIIQGREDSRTPARPIAVYVDRLAALGKPVAIEWYDSGHLGAGTRVEQRIAQQEMALKLALRATGQALSKGL